MTAGQRNCYEAIKEQAERYSLDDALFAVRELIRDARDGGAIQDREAADDALHHMERVRAWVRRAQGNS